MIRAASYSGLGFRVLIHRVRPGFRPEVYGDLRFSVARFAGLTYMAAEVVC